MAAKKVRPQIFWDPSSKKYILKCDYSTAFQQDFRTYTDHPPTFNGGSKTWSFDERDIAVVLQTVEQHFPAASYGKCDFIPKPPERRQVINGKQTPAGTAALRMFEVAGVEAAKQVYSMLIKRYHPDLNPEQSQEDKDKAAEITTNWRALKQHLNWS